MSTSASSKTKLWGHPGFKAICLNNKPIGVFLVSKGSTRAVKMVSNTTFDEWPHLERLEAFSEVGNLASQKVLLRVLSESILLSRKKLPMLSSLVFSLQTSRGRSRSGLNYKFIIYCFSVCICQSIYVGFRFPFWIFNQFIINDHPLW